MEGLDPSYVTPGERLLCIEQNWDSIVEMEGRLEAGKLYSEACHDCDMMDHWKREQRKRKSLVETHERDYFERGNLYLESIDGSWEDWTKTRTFQLEVWAQREWSRSHLSKTPGATASMVFPSES